LISSTRRSTSARMASLILRGEPLLTGVVEGM